MLPTTLQHTISKCQLLCYAHFLTHPFHIHGMLLHIRQHYCNSINLAGYSHITCNSKKIYALKNNSHSFLSMPSTVESREQEQKKMFTSETNWEELQTSLLQYLHSLILTFFPHYIMQILSHLWEIQQHCCHSTQKNEQINLITLWVNRTFVHSTYWRENTNYSGNNHYMNTLIILCFLAILVKTIYSA